MFAATKGGAVSIAKDSQFNLNALLLHGDGTNGANNNTFLDGSTNAYTITRNGTPTQGTFSPFSQTGWSNYFGGSDYLATTSGFNTAMGGFAGSTWTLECWAWISSLTSTNSYSTTLLGAYQGVAANGRWVWSYDSAAGVTGRMTFTYTTGTGSQVTLTASTATIPLNSWNHIAITIDATTSSSSTVKFFLNGVLTDTFTAQNMSTQTTNYSAPYICGGCQYYNNHIGFISNMRVIKGTLAYTSSFTVPITSLTAITNTILLISQSNRFLDNSSGAYNPTVSAGTPSVQPFSPFPPGVSYGVSAVGGSMYFNGSTDYLSSTGWNTAGNFGTGNFTIELWAYCTGAPNSNQVLITCEIYPNTTGFYLYYTDGGASGLKVVSGISQILASSGGWSFNAWHHIALVRNSGTLTLYIDGTSVGSAAFTTNCTDGIQYIGRPSDVANFMVQGYLSNIRIVKGTAVYTSNFTPPTAPVTAITNTQLLVNGTNAGIYDSTAKNDLITVGSAQISTTQSKFGGSSMYFNGTTDYITIPDSPNLQFGTGNFTVECWVYIPSGSGYRGIVCKGGAATGWALFIDNNGYWAITDTNINYSGNIISTLNNWTHVALVRNGNTLYLYVNGVQATSTATSTNFNQTDIMTIGSGRAPPSILFTGYIDELRVTRYARYTANFTPPSKAFPNQ